MQLTSQTLKIGGVCLFLSIQLTYSLPIKLNGAIGEADKIINGDMSDSYLSKRQLNLPINLLSSAGKGDGDSSDDDEKQKGSLLAILPMGGQQSPAPPLGAAPLPPLILGLASNMNSDD